MAKKSKKPAKKAAKKSSKPAGKSAKKASKKAAKKPVMMDPLAPIPVTTGRGLQPVEIGTRLVKMFNEGRFGEIEDAFWDKKGIASIEGVGVNLAWVGLKAVRAKNEGWMSDNVIHGASAEGPFVGSTGFTVRFKMDVETKSTGQRRIMDEVGVYTVEDGKIVCEEFMYAVG